MKQRIIDQVEFSVKAGDGGDGLVSFMHLKYKMKGGPDGGDGGNGGSVYFVANPHMTTLMDYAGKTHFEAGNGERGRRLNQHGKDAEDITLEVPVGTVVWVKKALEESGEATGQKESSNWVKLFDLDKPGLKALVAQGGYGGRGNTAFKSGANTTPMEFEQGTKGELKELRLEMKILADIGLVGLPNAGKSTLLSVLTAARPEIANYPFTTVSPNLGVLRLASDSQSHVLDSLPSWRGPAARVRFENPAANKDLIIADIPGLIEDAHKGKGLGIDFLKHIERCRILLYVISPTEMDLDATDMAVLLVEQYKTVRKEVKSYSEDVDQKPRIIVISKLDVIPEEQIEDIEKAFAKIGEKVIFISAATHQGLEELRISIADSQ